MPPGDPKGNIASAGKFPFTKRQILEIELLIQQREVSDFSFTLQ